MCHFVTAVLPESANREALTTIVDSYGRKLEPLANASIEAQLRPGERYFLTTHGACDCGTALGALIGEEAAIQKRKDAANSEEAKLKKKGWSQSKIARWRAQKAEHFAKPTHTQESTEWTQLLKDVLSSGYTESIGLLLHWYNGSLSGQVEIKGRKVISAPQITPEMLGRIQEDVLYEFKAEA